MSTPLLERQLQEQLSQFIKHKNRGHLKVFSENVAAILLSESAILRGMNGISQSEGITHNL